jgi:hypothetical protein
MEAPDKLIETINFCQLLYGKEIRQLHQTDQWCRGYGKYVELGSDPIFGAQSFHSDLLLR